MSHRLWQIWLAEKLWPATDVFKEQRAMEVCPSSMKFDVLTKTTSERPLLGTDILQVHNTPFHGNIQFKRYIWMTLTT